MVVGAANRTRGATQRLRSSLTVRPPPRRKSIGSGLIVYVDLNGNGFDYSDFGLQLTGVRALTLDDFLI